MSNDTNPSEHGEAHETAHLDERALKDYHKSRTQRDGGQLINKTLPSTDLSLAITRCMNYLPKHLYEDLLRQSGFLEGSYEYRAPVRGLRIFVNHVYPPIPDRSFDWCAHYDDEEGPTGEGSTPYMAILDLINNYSPTERAQD